MIAEQAGTQEKARARERRQAASALLPLPEAPPVRRRAPMGQRGPRVVRRARDLSWRSPMMVAVLVASFCVSLASLYVAAYARVTAESLEIGNLQRQVALARQRGEGLRAQISGLTLAPRVDAAATTMGMEPNTPKNAHLLLTSVATPDVSGSK